MVVAQATSVAFPGLRGVLPGVGRFDPLDWGLGFEVRGSKSPHWTGTRNSPATFGHFGGTGTFLWVDPAAGLDPSLEVIAQFLRILARKVNLVVHAVDGKLDRFISGALTIEIVDEGDSHFFSH